MAFDKINNLGKYADLSAVWFSHPEGGREGDYVVIGNAEYYWNSTKRMWEQTGGHSGGGSSSAIVEGDLTVGGNLRVGGDATVEGTLVVGDIRIYNEGRFKGQSSYNSIVFTRSNDRPSTPTGGSYSNPLPDYNIWKDGVPQGDKPIWMSSRVFTSDGRYPQQSSWSVPVLMSDAENLDVEFSNQDTSTTPVPPVEGPNGNLGWLWFDPVRNPEAPWDKMNWMATRTKSLSSNGIPVWSDWVIVLIKGESGSGVQNVYTITNGTTPSITGDAYPPSGWYKSVDNLTVNQGDVLWMSDRRFEGGQWSAWSAPVRLNGVDGLPGEDGTDIEFIFTRMNRMPNTDGYSDDAPDSVDADGDVPSGWYDHPSGVDAQHLYEWSCQRTKSGGTWSAWVGPFVWSAFGERGMDGDGVEYVFIRTEDKDASGPGLDATVADHNSHTAADRGYLPRATNSSINPENNQSVKEYTDNPKGVNNTYPYEWVALRRQVDGEWKPFGTPALWATYSEEHTIDISEDGYWVIDGVKTGKKAVGTGVAVKGKVDYYSTTSPGYTAGSTTLEGITTPSLGDSYVVEANGHLYLCVATSGTLETMWEDLGEFKGEPGQSQYLHIAWAIKINFSGNPQQYASNEGFTTDYAAGRNYDWMGICVDNSAQVETDPSKYKWNYLKGKDGTETEYVYVRTKVNTAPTITEAAVQTSERYPVVANYSSYAAGDIEFSTFQDDPNGVSEDWPFEWMSRREKVNGEWGTFLSPARLWSNWAEPGEPGESQPWVKPETPMIVIDADQEGKIPSQQTISLKCWLYVGKDRVLPSLSRCSATYGNSSANIGSTINPANPYITVSFSLPADTTLITKDLVVTMGNADATASTTVPVVINRAGQNGRDVYKSIVFKRSATKPTKPTTGDYYSPVPSGWSDGIEAGTLPVWMTSRIFSSDNQSPPQESSWSDVVLMQDTDTYDVEFTDASLDASPGTPDNPASGVTWYDPVDDADYLASHPMNWMAQKVKVVTANGTPVWGQWVVNKIRGEKGNDGAGQAYVKASPDKVMVDCNSDGTAKRAVNATILVNLMWGNDKCTLKTGCAVAYSGGGTVTVSQGYLNSDELEFEFDVPLGTSIQSGIIQVTLVGTDGNSVERTATLSVPIHVSTQGIQGNSGPALRLRGLWDSAVYYVYNDDFRDCVKYGNSYYMMAEKTTSSPGGVQTHEPDHDEYWTSLGNAQFFATDILLAENAAINLLSGNVINLFNSDSEKTASINADGHGSIVMYYPSGRKRYEMNYTGWNIYYNDDANNTEAWRIGNSGDIIKSSAPYWSGIMLYRIGGTRPSDNSFNGSDRYTLVAYPRYYAGSTGVSSYNEKIFASNVTPSGSPVGKTYIADGYYTEMAQPEMDMSSMSSSSWSLRVYHIVSGAITETFTITTNQS